MRILLLGKSGQLGRSLLRALAPLGEIISFGSTDADFREPRLLRELVRDVFPELIVNAAAYTDVDRAETDVDNAMAINAVGPGLLAEEAEHLGAGLVHYSSDYVFDGTSQRPYTEDDRPNPLSVYGHSKLLADLAISRTDACFLILRTSWVFGASGDNFFTKMLRFARQEREITLVDDQIVGPTWVHWVAEATATILRGIDPAMPRGPARYLGERRGLYNLGALGETTPEGFAREILRQDPWISEHKVQMVHRIALKDYRAKARRPQYCILDCTKAQSAFGVHLEGWSTHLTDCFSAITPEEAASIRGPALAP